MASAILVAALSVALVEAPVLAAPAAAAPAASPAVPLGVVLQAENARVGLDLTSSGETIYDGDRLQTPGDGTLRARLGAGQLFLRADTVAEVRAIAGGFSAELEHGSVVASAEGQNFRVIADGATIRPASAQPATAQVTEISSTELVLTSTRGVLEISMGEEVRTIEPGSSYRLVVEPADSGDKQPPPEGVGGQQPQEKPAPSGNQGKPPFAARNRFLLIAIPAIVVATGIIAWRVWISPASPGK